MWFTTQFRQVANNNIHMLSGELYTSQRRESIIPSMPNLAAEYDVLLLVPNFPAIDEILIT